MYPLIPLILTPPFLPTSLPPYLPPPPCQAQVITNFSRARCRLLDATFDLRNQDVVLVRRITQRISAFLRSHPALLEGATPPAAYLKALTASCMQVAVTATLKPMVGGGGGE